MSKVFWVTIKDSDDVTCFVQAASRSEAIATAMSADDSGTFHDAGWTNLRAYRCPNYDKKLTWGTLVEGGSAWVECPTCREKVSDGCLPEDMDTKPFYSPDGQVYCSESCWVADGAPTQFKTLGAICLDANR